MSHERDWARWREALDGAGVRRVRRHDARHTTATLLREAGVDPRVIQDILGHTSAKMTAHYSHLGKGEGRAGIGKLGALLGIATITPNPRVDSVSSVNSSTITEES